MRTTQFRSLLCCCLRAVSSFRNDGCIGRPRGRSRRARDAINTHRVNTQRPMHPPPQVPWSGVSSGITATGSSRCHRHLPSLSANDNVVADDEERDSPPGEEDESPVRFYLDMAVQDEPIGRLVFCVPRPKSLFPLHTENLLRLASRSRRSVDPACHYVRCAFHHAPQYVEGTTARYRRARVPAGSGIATPWVDPRNASSTRPPCGPTRTDSTVASTTDSGATRSSTTLLPAAYGTYEDDDPVFAAAHAVPPLPTLPVTGPGRGTTQLGVVRVAESPPEMA